MGVLIRESSRKNFVSGIQQFRQQGITAKEALHKMLKVRCFPGAYRLISTSAALQPKGGELCTSMVNNYIYLLVIKRRNIKPMFSTTELQLERVRMQCTVIFGEFSKSEAKVSSGGY